MWVTAALFVKERFHLLRTSDELDDDLGAVGEALGD